MDRNIEPVKERMKGNYMQQRGNANINRDVRCNKTEYNQE